MTTFDAFLLPEEGNRFYGPYPGRFTNDGLFVVVADKEGQLRRYPLSAVRVDVQGWRRLNAVREELQSKEREAIGGRLRKLAEGLQAIRHDTRFNAKLREDLMSHVRVAAESIGDEQLVRFVWEVVEEEARQKRELKAERMADLERGQQRKGKS